MTRQNVASIVAAAIAIAGAGAMVVLAALSTRGPLVALSVAMACLGTAAVAWGLQSGHPVAVGGAATELAAALTITGLVDRNDLVLVLAAALGWLVADTGLASLDWRALAVERALWVHRLGWTALICVATVVVGTGLAAIGDTAPDRSVALETLGIVAAIVLVVALTTLATRRASPD